MEERTALDRAFLCRPDGTIVDGTTSFEAAYCGGAPSAGRPIREFLRIDVDLESIDGVTTTEARTDDGESVSLRLWATDEGIFGIAGGTIGDDGDSDGRSPDRSQSGAIAGESTTQADREVRGVGAATAEPIRRAGRDEQHDDPDESGGYDRRFRDLHHAASDLSTAGSVEETYRIAVDAAEGLLDFHTCLVFERDGAVLRPVATAGAPPTSVGSFDHDQGIVGRTHTEGRTILVMDSAESAVAEPAETQYRSGLSVPIGDNAVLQAISTEPGYYDHSDAEVAELLVAHVEAAIERINTERRLRTQKRRVEQLHALATELESCHTHEELFDLVIESAREVLGFKWCGVLTAENGRFVAAAVSEAAPAEVGDRLLSVEDGMVGWVYRNGESDWTGNTRSHERSEPIDDAIQSGLAVPIGDIGVFNAVSDREGAFDESDVELAELLAGNVLEAYNRIEIQQRLRERREELNLLKQVQSRVLRHNIRNDLSIVQGLAERLRDGRTADTERVANRIIDKSERLVRTSEKARKLEQVLERHERTESDLGTVVEDICDRLREEYPDAALRSDIGRIPVRAHPNLAMAVENVVENALVHTGGHPHVEVTVRREGGYGIVRVVDDGPGIPEHETVVIDKNRETDLEHGSGVGLWLVRLIVDRSDGHLSFERTDEGTVVELALPVDQHPDD